METNAAADSARHRNSPSSERFLGLFSQPPPEGVTDGGDLDEHDIFWGGRDFSQPPRRDPRSLAGSKGFSPSGGFRRPDTFGILAALGEDDKERGLGHRDIPVLSRKASIPTTTSPPSASRMIPAIPKPLATVEYSQSVPARKLHQSAPVDVPVGQRRNAAAIDGADDGDSDEEMLPPHEIVARGSSRSPWTTFSVLEGKGRTLKGRDLRQVRNAVWRRTGQLKEQVICCDKTMVPSGGVVVVFVDGKKNSLFWFSRFTGISEGGLVLGERLTAGVVVKRNPFSCTLRWHSDQTPYVICRDD